MQVIHDESGRFAAVGQVAEHLRISIRRCNLAFLDDSLHGSDRVKGQHYSQRLNKRLDNRVSDR